MARMIPKGCIPLTEDLSKRITIFKRVNDLTGTKLAKKLGISSHTLSNIGRLEVGSINEKIIENLIKIDDVPYPATKAFFIELDNSYIENLPFNLFAKAVRLYQGYSLAEFCTKLYISEKLLAMKEIGYYDAEPKHECLFTENEKLTITNMWNTIKSDIDAFRDTITDAKYGNLAGMSEFMRKLHKLRVDNGLSIEEFMQSIGRGHMIWYKWLNNGNPSTDDIAKINEVYGTDFVI